MSSLSADQTDLANVETKLKALYDAIDVDMSTAGGGRVSIRRKTQIEFLERRRRQLRMQIALKGGTLEAASAKVQGVDTDHTADNGDWY